MRRSLLALMVAVFTAASAGANVTISIVGNGSASPASPTSGQAFTLTASGPGTVLFKVYADSSTDIGRITLTGSAPADIVIGNNPSTFPTVQTTPLSTALCRDWMG